jgi:hypothetical protein
MWFIHSLNYWLFYTCYLLVSGLYHEMLSNTIITRIRNPQSIHSLLGSKSTVQTLME